ncbi:hypothetical protein ZIOFF_035203 [Zingiber officinale]|uniref:Reverse transcriptase Ty1/copia-type domain-containing protein n=1 Tax=Zingiber officinale TaxID=94328 RepID=A0A8J5L0H7_ZINOF|nr:hypothetical protein ZIOFF_035203 [Zingiber officinale]
MQCPYEHSLYVRADNDNILLVSLYVDDLILTGSSPQMIKLFMEAMTKAFDMTDMGLMSYFLSLEVKQGVDGIFMTQEQYAKEVHKRFRMDDCNLINTPVACGTKLSKSDEGKMVDPTRFKSLVGSLRTVDAITTDDPVVIYEILVQQDNLFASRLKLVSGFQLSYGDRDVAFAPMGPQWKRLHQTCVEHHLTAGRFESLVGTKALECEKTKIIV